MVNGRTYLVTGAAGGIGAATAALLVDRGASVVMADLDGAGVAHTAEALGRSAVAFECDVTDADQVQTAVDTAVSSFGRLDGAVCNAGTVTLDTAWEASPADWDRQLRVNVTGTFVTARTVGRHLREHGGRTAVDGQGGGAIGNRDGGRAIVNRDGGRAIVNREGGKAIVNVASNAGKVGYPNMAAYNASKAAVINLTRSLALEWAPDGINVNAVCPGGVDTPMLAGVAEWLGPRMGIDPRELLADMGPAQLGRKVHPEEVAAVIAFLLSDDAAIIRGQSINVDAGDTPY